MKKPKATLTNEMLEEIYQKLCKAGSQACYHKDGKPVYGLAFYGTEEEIETMKKKLIELESKLP